MPHLSIILPFQNDALVIKPLLQRLFPALGSLGLGYEILCIDSGSADSTFSALAHERQFDQRIKIVRLARDFGKEAALACGLQLAKGDAVVMLDSDLRHPPETIVALVDKWREGFQIVYAEPEAPRCSDSLRGLVPQVVCASFHKASDVRLAEDSVDFCLLDRKAVNALNAFPERNRFIKGLASWIGFKQCSVPYAPSPSQKTKTPPGAGAFIRFGIDRLSSFSVFPLRLWSWVGAVAGFLSLILALLLFVDAAFRFGAASTSSPLLIGLLFFGGALLVGLALIGEYVARIFVEVKARPLYFISERVGFE